MGMNGKNGVGILGAVFALVAGGVRAAETRVEPSPGVSAAWVVPEDKWDGRAVLLLHGMASDMDDAGGLYKRLASALATHGIASLRINFRGEGDNKRTDLRSTAQTRREDALAAAAFLAGQKGVDAGRVGAVGWSIGTVSAMDAAAARPEAFRSVALWSSLSGDVGETVAQDAGPAYAQAMKEGAGTRPIPGWKTITLQKEFFTSYRGVVFERLLEKYPGAVLLVRGTDDYLPHHDDELLKSVRGRPAEALTLGGADHIFNVFDPKAAQADRAVEATVVWFERTL